MGDDVAVKDGCNASLDLDIDSRRFRNSRSAKLFENGNKLSKRLQAVQCLTSQNFLQGCLQSFSVS